MGPGLLLLFIVGELPGPGIYALSGPVAAQVGGVVRPPSSSRWFPADHLSRRAAPVVDGSSPRPGLPDRLFGVVTMSAVANSALILMLMAGRLVHGTSSQAVLALHPC
jgi:hypothetical protein